MTDNILPEVKAASLVSVLRAKIWMARWNLLLWAAFAAAISLSAWLLFPGALFWVDGGIRAIGLVTSIDFVLGPLLFILVANPNKTLMARRVDVVVLTSVQLLAMAWGGWQVYTQRPVAISYMREGFALPVTMDHFAAQKTTPTALPFSQLGNLPPAFFVNLPTGKEGARALSQAIKRKLPLTSQVELLTPLFSYDGVFSSAGRFQSYWAGEGAADWQEWTRHHDNKPASDYRFLLLGGRYGNAALVLDQNNQLLGHVRMPDGSPALILPAK